MTSLFQNQTFFLKNNTRIAKDLMMSEKLNRILRKYDSGEEF